VEHAVLNVNCVWDWTKELCTVFCKWRFCSFCSLNSKWFRKHDKWPQRTSFDGRPGISHRPSDKWRPWRKATIVLWWHKAQYCCPCESGHHQHYSCKGYSISFITCV